MAGEGLDIGSLWAHIGLDTTPLDAGASKSKGVMNGLAPSVRGLSSELATLRTVALGVGAAFGIAFGAQQIVSFNQAAIAAATDSERVYTRLGNQLDLLGGSYGENASDLKIWFNGMQRTSMFMDEDLAGAFQDLLLKTGSYDKALKDLPLAMNLAAATGKDLTTANEAIAKSEAGIHRGLIAMVPQLKRSLDPLGDLKVLIGGMAEKEMETFAGKTHQIAVTMDEFKESLGGELIDNLTPFVDLTERLSRIGGVTIKDDSILGMYRTMMLRGGAINSLYIEGAKFGRDFLAWSHIGDKPTVKPPMSPLDYGPQIDWSGFLLSDKERKQYGMEVEPPDYASRRAARETLFATGIDSLRDADSAAEGVHSAIAAGWRDMLASATATELGLEAVWSRYADAQQKVIEDQRKADIALGMDKEDPGSSDAFAKKRLDDLAAEHDAFLRNKPLIDAQVSLYKDLATSGMLSAADLNAAWTDYTAARIRQINDEAAELAKVRGMNPDDVNRWKSIQFSGVVDEQARHYADLKDSVASGLRDVLQANNLSKEKLQVLWTDYEDLRMDQIDAEVDRQVKAAAAAGRILNPAFLRESMGINLAEEKLAVLGTDMQKLARGMGGHMRDLFSETFFDAMKGDFTDFGDFLTSLMDSIMREISDMLADRTRDWIESFSWVKNLQGKGGGGGSGYGGTDLGYDPLSEIPSGGVSDVPQFAAGGIAMGPTLGIFGEREPEAIVPLSKFRDPSFMAGIAGPSASREGKVVHAHLHVHGVTDARSFKNSQTQILSSLRVAMSQTED